MLQQSCIKTLELLISHIVFSIAILSVQDNFPKGQGTACLWHAEEKLCTASVQLFSQRLSEIDS